MNAVDSNSKKPTGSNFTKRQRMRTDGVCHCQLDKIDYFSVCSVGPLCGLDRQLGGLKQKGRHPSCETRGACYT